eukprot:TRINITY_DN1379_c0_g1_i1.p1 TRINITY_DN1379_c0_g1~~TRINITY_DN1379_c0_g1_i1.p1  ORF type:complete len:138 (+),score=19.72 TRINITY_DN1379_c0_g1_i1:141-554(+)
MCIRDRYQRRVHGCKSAFDSFYLMIRNPFAFTALGGVGQIFMFLGKLGIASSTALIGYCIITYSSTYKNKIFSPFVPTFFFFLIGFLIGALIVSILAMAAFTILQCYCVDTEVHKKKGQPPQNTPEILKDYFQEHGK